MPITMRTQADIVDAALGLALLLLGGRVLHQDAVGDHRQDPDGDVDEEDPAPVQVLDQVAAERRPEHGRHHGRHGGHPEGRPALGGRERVENDRLLARLQAAAEEALHQAEHDDLAQALRDAAQEGRHREHRDADQEVALAPDRVGEPAGDGQDDAVGDEIGGERVGRLVARGGERPRDVGQRHVDDRGVEDLHEGGERHRDGDQPGVVGGFPALVRIAAHFSSTVGSTLTPRGRGSSFFSPESITIFTGTRWTILMKLPVAFSAGKAENFEPEPRWTESTWPCKSRSG